MPSRTAETVGRPKLGVQRLDCGLRASAPAPPRACRGPAPFASARAGFRQGRRRRRAGARASRLSSRDPLVEQRQRDQDAPPRRRAQPSQGWKRKIAAMKIGVQGMSKNAEEGRRGDQPLHRLEVAQAAEAGASPRRPADRRAQHGGEDPLVEPGPGISAPTGP
jgi:hypothetical protein